jgi:FtsP/CotA-like multicopper oxidase with cupredoxin domain
MCTAGCARYNMTVEAGKTYRVRMINAGSLAFLSVCFAGHNVSVVAADAYPIDPLQAACVDINLGQRCLPGFPAVWLAPVQL